MTDDWPDDWPEDDPFGPDWEPPDDGPGWALRIEEVIWSDLLNDPAGRRDVYASYPWMAGVESDQSFGRRSIAATDELAR